MATLLLAAACGGSPRTAIPLEQLSTPAYVYTSWGVDSTSSVALDGQGNLWRDDEKLTLSTHGFVRVRAARPDERDGVVNGFAQLPATPDPACTGHESLRMRTATSDTTWRACEGPEGDILAPYVLPAEWLVNVD